LRYFLLLLVFVSSLAVGEPDGKYQSMMYYIDTDSSITLTTQDCSTVFKKKRWTAIVYKDGVISTVCWRSINNIEFDTIDDSKKITTYSQHIFEKGFE
jgi:hypothetical protein